LPVSTIDLEAQMHRCLERYRMGQFELSLPLELACVQKSTSLPVKRMIPNGMGPVVIAR
jgi:hypothetical protein